MGHTSGDMIVYHKALHWARRHHLATVTKLSHRLVIDVENWLHVDSERLLSSPYATQAQMLTNFGYEQIRTECVMMVVQRWSTSGVLRHYRPRRIPYWNESHTFDAVARLVDPDQPYPHFLPWERISFERGADRPPRLFPRDGRRRGSIPSVGRQARSRVERLFSTIDSGCPWTIK